MEAWFHEACRFPCPVPALSFTAARDSLFRSHGALSRLGGKGVALELYPGNDRGAALPAHQGTPGSAARRLSAQREPGVRPLRAALGFVVRGRSERMVGQRGVPYLRALADDYHHPQESKALVVLFLADFGPNPCTGCRG